MAKRGRPPKKPALTLAILERFKDRGYYTDMSIANHTGIHPVSISQLKKRGFTNMHRKTKLKLAAGLGMTEEAFDVFCMQYTQEK